MNQHNKPVDSKEADSKGLHLQKKVPFSAMLGQVKEVYVNPVITKLFFQWNRFIYCSWRLPQDPLQSSYHINDKVYFILFKTFISHISSGLCGLKKHTYFKFKKWYKIYDKSSNYLLTLDYIDNWKHNWKIHRISITFASGCILPLGGGPVPTMSKPHLK